MNKQERMAELRDRGMSYLAIGVIFGVSRQRVHQILSGYQRLNNSGSYSNGWYFKLKELVMERDDNKCQRCDSEDNLLVHHQDSNDRNNDLLNLITLCNKCHLDLHRPEAGSKNTDKMSCDKCGSIKVAKKGFTWLAHKKEQVYYCRGCGYIGLEFTRKGV